tara:strand:- start:523 stop:705 length:183 start_codon:yes stop_codon:yes gene_type:complete
LDESIDTTSPVLFLFINNVPISTLAPIFLEIKCKPIGVLFEDNLFPFPHLEVEILNIWEI